MAVVLAGASVVATIFAKKRDGRVIVDDNLAGHFVANARKWVAALETHSCTAKDAIGSAALGVAVRVRRRKWQLHYRRLLPTPSLLLAVAAIPSLVDHVVAADEAGGGNRRCWFGQFTYAFCCNKSFSEGNPDCWDKRRFTYRVCCLSPDEELPSFLPAPNPNASKWWRVSCGLDVGGWMVHELTFYDDDACQRRIRHYARTLESGHSRGYTASNAFDQWVEATDAYFWYSQPSTTPGDAWLGLELARPVEVRCVGLWHNNIPEVPVTLQRGESARGNWSDVHHWPSAIGGELAMLTRGTIDEGGGVDGSDNTGDPTNQGAEHELIEL